MKLILLLFILIMSNLFAYNASCSTDDGKNFNIKVKNKVMTINNKYTARYQGTTVLGWYEYTNNGYTYLIGKFQGNQFPIEVNNKWGLDAEGTCYFEN
jgi:hypothetical protein